MRSLFLDSSPLHLAPLPNTLIKKIPIASVLDYVGCPWNESYWRAGLEGKTEFSRSPALIWVQTPEGGDGSRAGWSQKLRLREKYRSLGDFWPPFANPQAAQRESSRRGSRRRVAR